MFKSSYLIKNQIFESNIFVAMGKITICILVLSQLVFNQLSTAKFIWGNLHCQTGEAKNPNGITWIPKKPGLHLEKVCCDSRRPLYACCNDHPCRPDQTAPARAVWSRSTGIVKISLSDKSSNFRTFTRTGKEVVMSRFERISVYFITSNIAGKGVRYSMFTHWTLYSPRGWRHLRLRFLKLCIRFELSTFVLILENLAWQINSENKKEQNLSCADTLSSSIMMVVWPLLKEGQGYS